MALPQRQNTDIRSAVSTAFGADGISLLERANRHIGDVFGSESRKVTDFNPTEAALSWTVSPSPQLQSPPDQHGIIIKGAEFALLLSFHGVSRAHAVFVPLSNLDPYAFLMSLAQEEARPSVETLAGDSPSSEVTPVVSVCNPSRDGRVHPQTLHDPRLSTSLSFPMECEIPFTQRLLISQIVDSGDAILIAHRVPRGESSVRWSRDSLTHAIDEAHISFAIVKESGRISDERLEVIQELHELFESLLYDEEAWESDPRIEALESELFLAHAKLLSLVKGEDIAVVQSEDFDGTWNDWVALPISTAPECRPIQFTIHSPTGARR